MDHNLKYYKFKRDLDLVKRFFESPFQFLDFALKSFKSASNSGSNIGRYAIGSHKSEYEAKNSL